MLLAVDIGNTQTSFGIFDSHQLKFHWRLETKVSRTPDEYAAFLFPLLDKSGLGNVTWDGVAVSSVVPAADRSFDWFCEQYLHEIPYKVGIHQPSNFEVRVETPSQVGADRLANTAYACSHLKLPAIVVDLGTGTTLDVISHRKAFEGGAILPGVSLAVEALATKTAKLPFVDLVFPEKVIGKNTTDCIRAGILFGYCDMLDGLLERTVKEIGEPCTVVLTGGWGSVFQHRLKTPSKYLPHLTLEGIRILFELYSESIRQ